MKKNLMITICVFVLAACQSFGPSPTSTPQPTNTSTPTSTSTPQPTRTPIPPTPTATDIPPATLPHTVDVTANDRWVATNVFVTAGQSLSIIAIGKVNLGGGAAEATFGPNGGFGPCKAEDEQEYPCNMIGARYGALIGYVGSGEPFLVGSQAVIEASESGQLYLGINSVSLGDNTGSYTVRMEEP